MTGGILLSGAPAGRWTLDRDGHRLEVETGRTGRDRFVRLYVDGEPAAEATAVLRAALPYGEWSVEVVFDVLGLVDGQAARCALTPPKAEDGEAGEGQDGGPVAEPVAFAPAEGTRAARREAFARAHPVLYASRHVVAAAGRVLFPLLGLGALVKVLLEVVPWPDLRPPDIDLPSFPLPDMPLPDLPLPDLPEVAVPLWLRAVFATTKFWVPVLIAIGVAAKEVRQRRKPAGRGHEGRGAGGPARKGAPPAGSPSDEPSPEP